MKVIKIFILAIWVVATALFVIGSLTPLSFTHKAFLYLTFFISFNGFCVLTYLLTDFVKLKANNVLMGLVGASLLILTYEFFPKYESGWVTQKVIYVHRDNPKDIIAFQKNDLGIYGFNFRTIKSISVTPLYKWVTIVKKVEVNSEWVEVGKNTSSLD